MNWVFSYLDSNINLDSQDISIEVLHCFGLKEDEIKIYPDRVEGNPKSFSLNRWVTPIRAFVYDICVRNNKDLKELHVRIRLYNLFIFPILPAVFSGLISSLWFAPIIVYPFFTIGLGTFVLIELQLSKYAIRQKIKKLTRK